MALTQISTAGVKDDAVTAGKIPANAVGSSELADDAVDTAAIADDAVTDAKLANSINTAIAANTAKNTNATHTGDVTGSGSLTIASNAVTTAKIADEAVTLAKLPHGDGSSDGKFLRANNGADPTFETVSIPAGTTINNNADDRIITGSGTANTLEGEANLTWNGTKLLLDNSSGPVIDLYENGSRVAFIGTRSFAAHNGDGLAIQTNEVAPIKFFINNAEAFRMKDDGNFNISNGDLVIGTSGHGIDFSATANASSSESTTSMSNELFDDYEVGSWQPTWSPASGSIGHLSRHGDYVKIGRTVHCMFAISANGSTNESGELKLTGLPFSATIPNANGTRGGGGVLFPGYHMASGATKCVANGTTLYLLLSDSSRLQTNSSGIGYGYNAAQLSGMFSYITSS